MSSIELTIINTQNLKKLNDSRFHEKRETDCKVSKGKFEMKKIAHNKRVSGQSRCGFCLNRTDSGLVGLSGRNLPIPQRTRTL